MVSPNFGHDCTVLNDCTLTSLTRLNIKTRLSNLFSVVKNVVSDGNTFYVIGLLNFNEPVKDRLNVDFIVFIFLP